MRKYEGVNLRLTPLDEIQNLLAFAEAVKENLIARYPAHEFPTTQGERQFAAFAGQNANGLRSLWNLDLQQLLYGQHVARLLPSGFR